MFAYCIIPNYLNRTDDGDVSLLLVTNNGDYLVSVFFSFYYLLSFDKLQEEDMIFELELIGNSVVSYSHKINV